MNKQVDVKIPATSERSYPIFIGEHLLDKIGSYTKQYTKAKKLLVVTNSTVYELFGEIVKNSLDKEGFSYRFTVLADGEKYKNVDSLQQIWNDSLEFRLERNDAFIALGGGVIGDITGFAAATYLRGIDFVQVPTTLLAQVDSSVGGKVAINHPLGKNMLGAFYQPKFVLADIKSFDTLPVEQLKTGLAEVIKYGFIEKTCGLNRDFINYLSENVESIYSLKLDVMADLVEYCCQLKAAVVNQDEKEAGLRAILNFGHTIGHSVEKCTSYEIFTHGQAVAIGMKGALNIAFDRGLIDENYFKSSLELINLFKLDYKIPANIDIKSLLEAMMSDKKVTSGKKRFVLSVGYGEVEIFDNVEDITVERALKLLY